MKNTDKTPALDNMATVSEISIKRLMRLAQLKSNLVSVSLSGFILIMFGLIALVASANHHQDLLGKTLSYTLEAAVLFEDIEAIHESVQLIAEQGGVSEVTVFDKDHNELYFWAATNTSIWHAGVQLLMENLLVSTPEVPIMHDGGIIGYLHAIPTGMAIFIFLLCGLLIILLTLFFGTILSNFEMNRLHRKLWQSIDEMAEVARKAAKDKFFHLRASDQPISEFRELAEGLNFLLDEVESYKRKLEEENHVLSHQVKHDPLTGLANRLHFEGVLKAKLHQTKMADNLVALLYLDGYKFKSINDQYGHRAGDDVLIETARRLSSVVVRKDDLLARLGGDEFAILISNIKLRHDLQTVIDKIISVMEPPIKLKSGEMIEFTLNIGGAIYPFHAEDMEMFTEAADKAMYIAKKGAKKYHIHT